MDNVVRIVIEGVDDLLRAPTGCGEQTLSKFAPTVYAMMYLKETYQVTKEIEILGSRHIREGKSENDENQKQILSKIHKKCIHF